MVRATSACAGSFHDAQRPREVKDDEQAKTHREGEEGEEEREGRLEIGTAFGWG